MSRVIHDFRKNPDTPRELLPGCQWLNVLDPDMVNLQLTGTAYIVGSGPNGVPAVDTIPYDACTIALNSMIKYPRVWDWWIAFDHRIVEMDWWQWIEPPAVTTRLFSARLANRLFAPGAGDDPRIIRPDCVFNYLPGVTLSSFEPGNAYPLLMPRVLRGGMTVAGIAVQLAIHGGAREVVFCGVDMEGTGHWDGFDNPDKEVYGGVWEWAGLLSKYCREMENQRGVKFRSISKTRLDVEQPA